MSVGMFYFGKDFPTRFEKNSLIEVSLRKINKSAASFLRPVFQKIIQVFLVFVFKRNFFMVPLLLVNLFPHGWYHRFAHRGGIVFYTPLKFCSGKFFLIDPMGRFAFDQLQRPVDQTFEYFSHTS
jgi:hypothetical protein